MNKQRTVAVGVFEGRNQAQAAVGDLRRAGFSEDEIGVIARNGESIEPAEAIPALGNEAVEHSRMVEGAAAGLATGAGIGALWALGIAAGMLPAIGPIIAGGILATLAASAAGGAAVGGLVGALVGLGIPEEEAAGYEAHFVEGRTIVTVRANGRYAEAAQILESHGGRVSYPYTEPDKDEVVTRGSRPANLTSPIMGHTEVGTASASSTVDDFADDMTADVDEPIGTGEPMRADEPLKFNQAVNEPIRAADEQHLGNELPTQPTPASAATRTTRTTGSTRMPGESAEMPSGTSPEPVDRSGSFPGNIDRVAVGESMTGDLTKDTGSKPRAADVPKSGNEFDRPS